MQGNPADVGGHAVREEDDDLLCCTVIRSKDLLSGIKTGLYVGTAIVDVAHRGGGGRYGGVHLGDVIGEATVVPITGAEAYDGHLVAGCDAGLVQNAGDEFLYGCFRVGAALAVHTVGAVDTQYDVGRPDRLDLHQVGGGHGHGHIEVIAAGVDGRLLDGDHAVLGRNKGALLHDLAVSHKGRGESSELHAAQEHAEEQKSGNNALVDVNAFHVKYLRKT